MNYNETGDIKFSALLKELLEQMRNTDELETHGCADEMRYLKPKTIAEWMDVSVDTVLAMMHKGELEGVQFGAHWRIKLKSFLDYLERHRCKKDELEAS
jgi:excisionase family DNA binding protein